MNASIYILTSKVLRFSICTSLPTFVIYRLYDPRRHWHSTPVLLPGKSHGWRSLEGCSPWGRWGSDTTEWLRFHFSLSCIGEGNGNPLQCSCLENSRDGGAWWAAVHGVAQSRTRLKWLSSSSSRLYDDSHSDRWGDIPLWLLFAFIKWLDLHLSSDTEHLSFYMPFACVLWKKVYSDILHIFQSLLFLLLSCMCCLYVSDMNHLKVISCKCLLAFSRLSLSKILLAVQNLLHLIMSHLGLFVCCCCCFLFPKGKWKY